MELDKSLLMLSSGGVGLLVTIVTVAEPMGSLCSALILMSSLSFIISIFSVLFVFRRNSTHILRSLKGEEDEDPTLDVADAFASRSFEFGVILSLGLIISIIFQ